MQSMRFDDIYIYIYIYIERERERELQLAYSTVATNC